MKIFTEKFSAFLSIPSSFFFFLLWFTALFFSLSLSLHRSHDHTLPSAISWQEHVFLQQIGLFKTFLQRRKWRRKVSLSPHLIKYHTMKKMGGGGGIDPHFLKHGSSWRSVVSYTTWPLHPRGKSPQCPLYGILVGPPEVAWTLWSRGISLITACRGCPVRNLVFPDGAAANSFHKMHTHPPPPHMTYSVTPNIKSSGIRTAWKDIASTLPYAVSTWISLHILPQLPLRTELFHAAD